ncbi:hypothetical protein [Lysobacter sp. Root667]|uniref:hypothetical protein n=1 Tax=Lysobacter sp. Root667 TaxID=1736581 RepID=UPI0012DE8A5C|nr:hypothetical protein [Lysobacter sp. Root667]
MNTIIFFQSLGRDWSPEYWAVSHGASQGEYGEFVVESFGGWISVSRDPNVLDDYESDEAAVVRKAIPTFEAYVIEWRGGGLIDDLLSSIPAEHFALIDNDHGLVVSIDRVRGLPLDSWIKADRLPVNF